MLINITRFYSQLSCFYTLSTHIEESLFHLVFNQGIPCTWFQIYFYIYLFLPYLWIHEFYFLKKISYLKMCIPLSLILSSSQLLSRTALSLKKISMMWFLSQDDKILQLCLHAATKLVNFFDSCIHNIPYCTHKLLVEYTISKILPYIEEPSHQGSLW